METLVETRLREAGYAVHREDWPCGSVIVYRESNDAEAARGYINPNVVDWTAEEQETLVRGILADDQH
jgi:hypothetical protein